MKTHIHVLTAMAAVLTIVSCGGRYPEPVNPNATPQARQLLESLYESVEEGRIISGLHHNRLGMPEYMSDLDRIAEASGVEPKIWGGDFISDGDRVVELAKENYASGHIITLMWHAGRPFDRGPVSFRNQVCGKFTPEQWDELMTVGSDMYNMWLAQVDSISVNYLKPLYEAGIPVLWRPYHEMNGEWFWWGWREGENGFAELYRRLWDRMVNYHHLDNLIWVWNANAPRDIPGDTAKDYALYYPGDRYVDVLATDVYNRDWKQSHHDRLLELGGGKLIALGELGSLPSPEQLAAMNKYAWFMIWTGFTEGRHNTKEELAAIFNRPGTVSLTLPDTAALYPKDYSIKSPDGRTVLTVSTLPRISWQVSRDGCTVLTPSEASITLAEGHDDINSTCSADAGVIAARTGYRDETIGTPIYHKSEVRDRCSTLTLQLSGGIGLEFRAYDEGVAYRFSTTRSGEMTVVNEKAEFNIDSDRDLFIPYVNDCRAGERWCWSFEAYYDEIPFSLMAPDSLATIPLLVDLGGGRKAAIMEAGAEDYPGMFLKRSQSGKTGFVAEFAPYPLETEVINGNIIPTLRAGFLARTAERRTFPWRVVVISDSDADLADCDLSMILSPECRIKDTSWIRPGKASWEWWSSIHVSGVDFKAGNNTGTYKYFVDFSAANGLEYVVIDAGWSGKSLMDVRDDLELQEVVRYGESKGVGIILWALWSDVLKQEREVFPHYAGMGVKGFKVDFIDSDDQVTVRELFRTAALAAENHLVLDLHGCKPVGGLHRAYPNVLNFEGVKGLENSRWIDLDGNEDPINDVPRYDVICPFTRMMLGPMDFTPGAMDHATWEKYVGDEQNPHVIGTRVHQMAMFTVYQGPLQMLCDSPTKYKREQECTDFISRVPTVYDRTIILGGQIGEYIIAARMKDGVWYVGALTGRKSREVTMDFSFLGEGTFTADIFEDGINADRCQEDYRHTVRPITSRDRLTVRLAETGGWTARIARK